MGKTSSASKKKRSISSIENEIEDLCKKFAELRSSNCYPLLIGSSKIENALVDRVFDELRLLNNDCKKLDVIVDSGGGDLDAAYNLALLFRRFGSESLTFVIPRWAKSAATLLICSGDEILMTPVAEIGPLDPQITAMNPLENRIEKFSPLHIESTLQLIRNEFESGHSKLAEGLLQRLQFPMTLGRFKKSLELGRDYLKKLLTSRMLQHDDTKAIDISERLTTGYADHSWSITINEAQELGLVAHNIDEEFLDIVWKIHKLNREKREKEKQENSKKIRQELKKIPPELLKNLPPDI